MDLEYIEQLACEFRNALDVIRVKKLYGRLTIFEHFPKECCGYTSDLLATYLIDKGISRERIRVGKSKSYEEEHTHCWIMIDDILFVDITADQFNGKPYFKKYEPIPACCIVTRDTYLYECFDKHKTQYSRNIGINSYSGDVPAKLQVVYDAVLQQIVKNHKGDRRNGILY